MLFFTVARVWTVISEIYIEQKRTRLDVNEKMKRKLSTEGALLGVHLRNKAH